MGSQVCGYTQNHRGSLKGLHSDTAIKQTRRNHRCQHQLHLSHLPLPGSWPEQHGPAQPDEMGRDTLHRPHVPVRTVPGPWLGWSRLGEEGKHRTLLLSKDVGKMGKTQNLSKAPSLVGWIRQMTLNGKHFHKGELRFRWNQLSSFELFCC